MNVPFTLTEFMEVFSNYNTSIFPLQIFFNILAVLAIALLLRKKESAGTLVSGILAVLWVWMGLIYHIAFFSAINQAAYIFGALYIVEAALFVWYGVLSRKLRFEYTQGQQGIAGWVLLIYALVVYPLLGYAVGHVYPASPTFGLPCPTTIFTFGLLLWSRGRVPLGILVIPFMWSLIGFSAALTLGMYEDVGLLVAGVSAMALLLIKNRREFALMRSHA